MLADAGYGIGPEKHPSRLERSTTQSTRYPSRHADISVLICRSTSDPAIGCSSRNRVARGFRLRSSLQITDSLFRMKHRNQISSCRLCRWNQARQKCDGRHHDPGCRKRDGMVPADTHQHAREQFTQEKSRSQTQSAPSENQPHCLYRHKTNHPRARGAESQSDAHLPRALAD